MNIEKLPPWLRWILVLPGAIIGGLVAFNIIRIMSAFGINRFVPPEALTYSLLKTVGILPENAISIFVFISLGNWIVPKHKLTVSLVLSGLILLITGGSIIANLGGNYQPWIELILAGIGAVLGISASLYQNFANKFKDK